MGINLPNGVVIPFIIKEVNYVVFSQHIYCGKCDFRTSG